MKLKKILLPLAVVSVFSLASCQLVIKPSFETTTTNTVNTTGSATGTYEVPTPDNPNGYNVTFVVGNGNTVTTKATDKNMILEPSTPTKVASTFTGWYLDKACKEAFNFKNSISKDTVLYAGWNIDYISLYNEISATAIQSNVRIEVSNYDIQGFGRKTNQSSSLGSGGIFYEDSKYYYALTNNHVIYTKTQYQEITIEDCFENEYQGTLLGHLNTYDLALLRFAKGTEALPVIHFASYELETDDTVFSLGEPEGQSNSILGGTVSGMKTFSPDADTLDKSNITFAVYTHTCPITNGSSGGMLIDSNLNLVGINFASSVSKSGEFRYAYAIPLSKVREFISQYLTIEI